MKDWCLLGFALSVLLTSCISVELKPMTNEEYNNSEAEIVDTVTTTWLSFNMLHIVPSESKLERKAVFELKKEAKKQGHTGNIDIRNISVTGNFHGLTLLPIPNLYGLFANVQEVTASGDVVVFYNSGQFSKGIEGALARAAEEAVKSIPAKSRIAIVYITSQDKNTTEYVAGELEYIWVHAGYFISDRNQLDHLRKEKDFGMSGEVDDKTVVDIGKIVGASIIVTGKVDGEGNLRRLRLRALNTQTAQVISVASEWF